MPTLSDIHESIEARLVELRSEMTSLQAARTALHANGVSRTQPSASRSAAPRRDRTPKSADTKRARSADAKAEAAPVSSAGAEAMNGRSAKAVTTRKPRTAAKRSAAKRGAPEVLLAGGLEAMLRQSPDKLSANAIARQANARGGQVRDLLRELQSAGRVRQIGARSTSRWRLITDEERIAERAAELEQLSGATP